MAARTSGGNMFLAFVVGALLVLVLAIGWMVWSGGLPIAAQAPNVDMDITLPETPNLPAPAPNPEPTPVPSPVPKPG